MPARREGRHTGNGVASCFGHQPLPPRRRLAASLSEARYIRPAVAPGARAMSRASSRITGPRRRLVPEGPIPPSPGEDRAAPEAALRRTLRGRGLRKALESGAAHRGDGYSHRLLRRRRRIVGVGVPGRRVAFFRLVAPHRPARPLAAGEELEIRPRRALLDDRVLNGSLSGASSRDVLRASGNSGCIRQRFTEARARTERWVRDRLYCASCGHPGESIPQQAGRGFLSFVFGTIRTQEREKGFGAKVLDGAFRTMCERPRPATIRTSCFGLRSMPDWR